MFLFFFFLFIPLLFALSTDSPRSFSPYSFSPFPFPPPTPAPTLFAAICYNILSGCCSIFSLWKHLSKQRVALRVCVAVSLSLCLCPFARLFLSLLSESLVRIITQRTYIALDFVVIAYGELVASPSPSSVSSVQLSSVRYVQLFNKVFSSSF